VHEHIKDQPTPSERSGILAGAIHDALWDWDITAGTIWWNDGFRELFGYKEANTLVSPQTWHERIHPEDKEQVTKNVDKCILENYPSWQQEYRLLRADGNYVLVLDRGFLQLREGRPVKMIGSIIIVTEWNEKTEGAERMRLALDSAGLGTWDLNISTRVFTMDERCRQFHALQPDSTVTYDELLRNVYSFDQSRVEAVFRNALKPDSGGYYDAEYRVARTGGGLRWVRSQGKAYFDEKGEPYRFTGTSVDISDEKRKDQVLQDVEKRFQAAFDNASLGIAMAEPNGKIILVNKAFSEMTGYTQEELYHNSYEKITHPEDLENNKELVRKMVVGESATMNIDKRYIRKDGSPVWVNLHTTLIFNSQGEPDILFSIIRDITAERTAQVEQEKLLTLVNGSVELMAVLDINGKSSYLNQSGRELLGFDDNEQVKQTPLSLLLSEPDLAKLKKEILPSLLEKRRWTGEMMVKNIRTGEFFPVQNSSLRIDDPHTGEPIAVGTVMRDLRPELESRRELKESEERFRSVVEQAPVAIGILKGEKLIVEAANDPLLHLWRKTRAVVGLPLLEALPELTGQPFPELLAQTMRSGIAYKGIETHARLERNGQLEDAWFNFVYSPIHEAGSINSVMVIATEVTEQVITKKELEKTEQRFRNLVNGAPIPIAVYTGREMVIQLANQAVLDTWGKDASVIGKTFRQALPELEGQPFFKLLDEVYTTGKTYQATEDKVDLFINGKMQTFYFNFTYKALHDSQGKIYGIINTATDVTDLVHAREELKEAQEKLRIAIESAKMGTWTINPGTGQAIFSDRLKELFGFDENELDIFQGFTSIHENDRERVVANFMKALEPGSDGAYEDEYTIINARNGQEHIIRSVGKVFFENDEAAYVIGTVQDITNQKLNEQQLETLVEMRTEELKNANRFLQRSNEELEQFAYVASHDLQEPLRKIRMFSGMLKEIEAVEKSSIALNYLDKVTSSAERMSNLIQDLLNFSKINKGTESHERVDLNLILKQVKEDFELLIRQKRAVLEVGHLPVIRAIPLQMNQLFYNLIGNALKFTDDSRPPYIRVTASAASETDLQHVPEKERKNFCLIKVQDNGIGFDDELAEKIFTIFQRLHVRSEYEGTGIGLALCKKIVVQLGGAIWAHGAPGRGADFYLVLPCIEPL
jgi:PAS domain S-box-containing protein